MSQLKKGWTEIRFEEKNDRAVMPNNYIKPEVFDWLEEHICPAGQFERTVKYALAEKWSYTQTIGKVHVFFFKSNDDAMRFKLTWG